MAQWHLDELQNTLQQRGWRIVSQLPGDNYRIATSWLIQRSTQNAPLLLDFDGLDDMKTLPLEQSYGCAVREHPTVGLYFGRKGYKSSSRRAQWRKDLIDFVAQLDELETK